MQRCPHCDSKLKKCTKICPECGMVLDWENIGSVEQLQQKRKGKIYAVLAIMMALVVVATSVFLVVDRSTNRKLSAGEIYNLIAPSTVEISARSVNFSSTGTGFFIDDKGTVITNYHVIEACYAANIILSDGTEHPVLSVLGYDEKLDVAILATGCASSVPLSYREDTVNTGEKAYTLGSSLGLTGTFAEGIISSSNRKIHGENFIQTTAPISSGNSGGPLVDEIGKVIGITTAAFEEGQNLNLAVPIILAVNIDKDCDEEMGSLFLKYYGLDEDFVAVRRMDMFGGDDEWFVEYFEEHNIDN